MKLLITGMADSKGFLCLLLVLSTLGHVTSFTVKRRYARHADLADALRMLERQRRRIDNEDKYISGQSVLLGGRHFPASEFEPWLELPAAEVQSPTGGSEVNAAWLAKTLGLDDNRNEEIVDDTPGTFLEGPVEGFPVVMRPTDDELDTIFGEKDDTTDNKAEADAEVKEEMKKDKMLPEDIIDDVGKGLAMETKGAGDAASLKTTVEESVKLDTLTKDEFKALLRAVEKLQNKIVTNAKEDLEDIKEDIKEAKVEAASELTPKPEPVSEEELDNLFEEKTKEVIPTGTGSIVKTEGVLKDSEGRPVGHEEEVKEVETVPGKATLSSIEKFWYLNNYMNSEGEKRKKRNSKRNTVEPVPPAAAQLQRLIAGDKSGQVGGCLNKINQLQAELDKVKLVAYLEDIENDILTDALNKATLARVDGRVSSDELHSLQEAIQIEEALQEVKDTGDENDDEAEEDVGEEDKRGEPWRKKRDPLQSEVPYYLTGDSDDEQEETADDKEESTALALQQLLDEERKKASLQALLKEIDEARGDETDEENEGPANDFPSLLREASPSSYIASLFSENPGQCPAVREFTTNCEFADKYGLPIDFEARALCNVHEMCYACGHTLHVQQDQCDFIYRAASMLLCEEDEECELEAEVFLRTMKLKHRYVPYRQSLCRSQCAAQFLSIV